MREVSMGEMASHDAPMTPVSYEQAQAELSQPWYEELTLLEAMARVGERRLPVEHATGIWRGDVGDDWVRWTFVGSADVEWSDGWTLVFHTRTRTHVADWAVFDRVAP